MQSKREQDKANRMANIRTASAKKNEANRYAIGVSYSIVAGFYCFTCIYFNAIIFYLMNSLVISSQIILIHIYIYIYTISYTNI